MTPFDWNGLRRGDDVFVHAGASTTAEAETAVVRFVEKGEHRGQNRVGVRLQRPGSEIVWPNSRAVHLERVAPAGSCWRCDAVRTNRSADGAATA